MRQHSLAEEFVNALHSDPAVRSRVGDRVRTSSEVSALPDIVISQNPTRKDEQNSTSIVLTCRAKTSVEADHIGSAVRNALRMSLTSRRAWVVQDRSGYDSSSRAFRRVISVQAKR